MPQVPSSLPEDQHPQESLVAGMYMDRSIADFQRSCEAHIAEAQREPNPDTALIALLCDAVRCSRELTRAATRLIGEPWWHRIDTAPCDGTLVIGYRHSRASGDLFQMTRFSGCSWVTVPGRYTWTPDFWMALPKGPSL